MQAGSKTFSARKDVASAYLAMTVGVDYTAGALLKEDVYGKGGCVTWRRFQAW